MGILRNVSCQGVMAPLVISPHGHCHPGTECAQLRPWHGIGALLPAEAALRQVYPCLYLPGPGHANIQYVLDEWDLEADIVAPPGY